VLLLERSDMPRPKVCGCCLSPQAHAALRALVAVPAGASLVGEIPLEHVRVLAAGRSIRVPLPAGGVISREALDTALVQEAITAGAAWLPGVEVTAVCESPEASPPLRVGCRSAAATFEVAAAAVVVAAGLVDRVRVAREPPGRRVRRGSRVGIGGVLPADAADVAWGELVMAVGSSGYCGIVRLEDGRIDVAAAVDRRSLASDGPRAAVARILREAGTTQCHGLVAEEALGETDLRATPPLSHATPLVGGTTRRIFRVGDAAGYVEPFTGEGMGWALSSSRILTAALLGSPDPAGDYERLHAAGFRSLHRRCRRVAATLRHPGLVRSAMRVAAVAPWAARRFVPLVVGATSGSGATS